MGQRSRRDESDHLDRQHRQEYIDDLEPQLIESLGREGAAVWFSTPNPLLDHEPPVDVIRNGDLERVVEAAEAAKAIFKTEEAKGGARTSNDE